jgi:acetaldehyde dehydrogenase/alcohol dehydrogenase
MWFFFSPNIVYGENALDYFEHIPGKKCFIITDEGVVKAGLLDILTEKLTQYGKEFKVFSEVESDPHEDSVLKAREHCMYYEPDIVIGFGGGSPMDVAKSVRALYEYPNMVVDDLHPINEDLYNLGNKSKLITIPTTSGTGADITWAVVINRNEGEYWRKLEQAHKGFVPDFAIVDPVFPATMPPKLTVGTAFDALSHSIEGLFSVWRNDFSDALSYKAVEMIFEYLPKVVKNPNDMEARDKIHQAASMAGLAFGNSQANLAHSMGHAFGAVFHVHHGLCVGLFLPLITQFCINNPDEMDETIPILGKLAKLLNFVSWDTDNKEAANLIVKKIKELQKAVNFPLTIKDVGVSREDLDKNLNLLVSLCFQSSSSVMSPRPAGADDYKKMYICAYEGKDVDF